MIRLALAGEGAFGTRHLQALAGVRAAGEAEVTLLIGGVADTTRRLASSFGIARWTTDFATGIADAEVDAVILATPTPLHAAQAIACLEAGRHVLVEIPMAESLREAEDLVLAQEKAERVAMVGHLRRFNAGHAWVHRRILRGELTLRHLVVETFFLRRTNVNLLGEPRSWTDNLLWHHACHSVDLFLHQTGEAVTVTRALAGPSSPTLGIPLDLSIQLATPRGAMATLALSFNHEGPTGSTFRYVCDEGTFVAHDDELTDGNGAPLDLTLADAPVSEPSGLANLQAEFLWAIASRREPEASVARCLPAMKVLDHLERELRARQGEPTEPVEAPAASRSPRIGRERNRSTGGPRQT